MLFECGLSVFLWFGDFFFREANFKKFCKRNENEITIKANQRKEEIRGKEGVKEAVVNNNININKISINNFYNRQDNSQELYSLRSNPPKN